MIGLTEPRHKSTSVQRATSILTSPSIQSSHICRLSSGSRCRHTKPNSQSTPSPPSHPITTQPAAELGRWQPELVAADMSTELLRSWQKGSKATSFVVAHNWDSILLRPPLLILFGPPISYLFTKHQKARGVLSQKRVRFETTERRSNDGSTAGRCIALPLLNPNYPQKIFRQNGVVTNMLRCGDNRSSEIF